MAWEHMNVWFDVSTKDWRVYVASGGEEILAETSIRHCMLPGTAAASQSTGNTQVRRNDRRYLAELSMAPSIPLSTSSVGHDVDMPEAFSVDKQENWKKSFIVMVRSFPLRLMASSSGFESFISIL